MMPKVSVVIPCYNQGKFINEAVESVLSQTFQDFEIIIVNDGSTDEYTNNLLINFNKPGITIIHTENKGVSEARNHGIRVAKGELILPLDADDKIGKNYLKKAVEIIDNNPAIGIVYCLVEKFGAECGIWKLHEYSLGKILLSNIIFCCAVFRKSDWIQTKGYNPNMAFGFEDWDFWLSILELGKDVYRIPEIMFYYRIKQVSRSKSMDYDKSMKMRMQILNNHEDFYKNNFYELMNEIGFINGSYYELKSIKDGKSYKISNFINYFVNIFKKIIMFSKVKHIPK